MKKWYLKMSSFAVPLILTSSILSCNDSVKENKKDVKAYPHEAETLVKYLKKYKYIGIVEPEVEKMTFENMDLDDAEKKLCAAFPKQVKEEAAKLKYRVFCSKNKGTRVVTFTYSKHIKGKPTEKGFLTRTELTVPAGPIGSFIRTLWYTSTQISEGYLVFQGAKMWDDETNEGIDLFHKVERPEAEGLDNHIYFLRWIYLLKKYADMIPKKNEIKIKKEKKTGSTSLKISGTIKLNDYITLKPNYSSSNLSFVPRGLEDAVFKKAKVINKTTVSEEEFRNLEFEYKFTAKEMGTGARTHGGKYTTDYNYDYFKKVIGVESNLGLLLSTNNDKRYIGDLLFSRWDLGEHFGWFSVKKEKGNNWIGWSIYRNLEIPKAKILFYSFYNEVTHFNVPPFNFV